jgi:hypothetical protein
LTIKKEVPSIANPKIAETNGISKVYDGYELDWSTPEAP